MHSCLPQTHSIATLHLKSTSSGFDPPDVGTFTFLWGIFVHPWPCESASVRTVFPVAPDAVLTGSQSRPSAPISPLTPHGGAILPCAGPPLQPAETDHEEALCVNKRGPPSGYVYWSERMPATPGRTEGRGKPSSRTNNI